MSASDTIMKALGVLPDTLDNITKQYEVDLDCSDVTGALCDGSPESFGDRIISVLARRAINEAIDRMGEFDEDGRNFILGHFSANNLGGIRFHPNGFSQGADGIEARNSYELDAFVVVACRRMAARNKNP